MTTTRAAKVTLDPHNTIFTVDGLLSPAECLRWIAWAESIGFGAAPVTTAGGPVHMPDLRNNTRMMVDDAPAAESLWKLLAPFVPQTLHAASATGLNERLRFYRYDGGQHFDWHLDGYFARDETERSYLTVLLYLGSGDPDAAGTGCDGGQTEFGHLEAGVEPLPGRALLFEHPVLHRGAPVFSGRKYVLRTDVMYRLPE